MTDSADDISIYVAQLESYLEKQQNFFHTIKENAEIGFWQTATGEQIKIENLDHGHRSAIIQYLKRREIDIPHELIGNNCTFRI